MYNEGVTGVNFQRLKQFIHKEFGKIPVHVVKLKEKAAKTRGLLFDFIATQKAFSILPYSKKEDSCHIIVTKTLFATPDEQKRLHIRSSIFSFPSLISIPGIVEGPAKPKEYYLYKQKFTQLRIWDIEEAKIEKQFKGRFIDYEDKRMEGVLKGFIAQALFFYITGEPFCLKKSCRLYNAHWQEELIRAQLESARFCIKHKRALRQIREKTSPVPGA